MGKMANMLYMIDLLNTGNKYSVSELAVKLNVSKRMIRYYKDELEKNGIFIQSFKGPNGGYFLIDNLKYYINFNKYDIDLLKYSYTFLEHTDFKFKGEYQNLIDKADNICSVVEEKSKFITNITKEDIGELYEFLNNCISKEEKIEISYLDINGEIVSRIIHPLQLFKYKDCCYVTAYCELRQDIRHFDLNRKKIIECLIKNHDFKELSEVAEYKRRIIK